jgi:hypothetical protein
VSLSLARADTDLARVLRDEFIRLSAITEKDSPTMHRRRPEQQMLCANHVRSDHETALSFSECGTLWRPTVMFMLWQRRSDAGTAPPVTSPV